MAIRWPWDAEVGELFPWGPLKYAMMHSSFLLSQLVFGALALATPHSLHTRTSSIQWTPCTVNSSVTITVPIECASLAVPLDYTNTLSKATLDLELLRVPHLANSEFKGSILTNFGGPGASGQEDLAVLGDMYQAFSGGRYDIVTVVPRSDHLITPSYRLS